jgi:hypothetical protein
MFRNRRMAVVLLAALIALPAIARDEVSTTVSDAYSPAERKRLAPVFINTVATWLQRYDQTLLTREANYVKMQVRYDYVYTLELTITDDEYEIKVTGSDRARGTPSGQRNANHLATGILERMAKKTQRRDVMKDRWQQSK